MGRLHSSQLLSSKTKGLVALWILLLCVCMEAMAVCEPPVEVCAFAETEELTADDLSPEQLEAFKAAAQRKTAALNNYIKIISNKSEKEAIRSKSIALALRLFVDDKQPVQVSSALNESVKNITIRQYLNNLKVLPYRRVDIRWFDIAYVREFKKGRDGKYYAVITIFQEYKGFSAEGQLLYTDITQKEIEVVLDRLTRRIGDTEVKEWDVLLRGIRVVETKS
jgi:hypothetical protein